MINRLKYRTIQVFKKYSLPRWLVLVIDISAVFLSFLLAYLLRFNLVLNAFNMQQAVNQAFFVSAVYLVFMLLFKSYSGLIRQTTVKDTFIIALTNTTAFTILLIVTLIGRQLGFSFDSGSVIGVPVSILMIHFGVATVAHIFFRVLIKMFYVFVSIPTSHRKNVLVYGSGALGLIVKRMLQSDPRSGYQLKGFIDDNSKLQGKKLDGYPVFSIKVLTREFVESDDISVFIFAIKDISPVRKKEVLESVLDLGLEILETPSVDKWLNGQLQVKQLRKVEFEDLLGQRTYYSGSNED